MNMLLEVRAPATKNRLDRDESLFSHPRSTCEHFFSQ